MKKRVLHVIPSVSQVHGGPSRAIRMIEQALAQSNWHTETATTDDDGPKSHLTVKLGQRVLGGHAIRWYFRKNTDFYKVSWSFMLWILREVKHYDVIHIHALFSFTSVVAAWAAHRAGVPYIIRPLGVLNSYGVTQRRPFFKRLSLYFVEAPLLRRAAAIHFTSEAEQNEAMRLGIPLQSVVIPLGMEQTEQGKPEPLLTQLALKQNGLRLLCLSRLDPVKNIENLLYALTKLRQAGIQPTLLIAGDGNPTYVQKLKILASKEKLDDQICWLGHVSGQTKADLFAIADIFMLPSFSENFGIAAVEALTAGLPCVIGRGVALSGAVEHAGAGLVVDTDPESIASGIMYYQEQADRRVIASVAAKKLADSEYSIDKMGERLISLYNSL